MYIPLLQLHTIPTHNNLTRVGYICTINVSMYCIVAFTNVSCATTLLRLKWFPWEMHTLPTGGGGNPLIIRHGIKLLLACWTNSTICRTIPFDCTQTLETAGLSHRRPERGKRQVMLHCLTSLQFLQVNSIRKWRHWEENYTTHT